MKKRALETINLGRRRILPSNSKLNHTKTSIAINMPLEPKGQPWPLRVPSVTTRAPTSASAGQSVTATAKTGSCICKLDDVNMPIQNRLSAAICIFHRECTPSGCPSLRDNQTHCANTVIQRRAFPETEVYQTPHCGNGLRLLENVTPGTAIVEYTGQVISDDECTARRNKLKNNEDFYFASLCAGYVLDAKPMGSRARFANHSCQPNCEMQKWVVGGEPRLVLVSLAAIEAGSDVTYNYHCHDDGLEVKIKRQKCLCGAKCCAGTIGGRVTKTEFDKWSQRAQSLLRSDKWIHIDAYRRHIEAASDVSSILYKDLKGVVDLVDDWVRDTYSPVFAFLRCGFSGQFELRSSEYIENVLSTFPVKNVRCDEYQHVNQIYKTAGKVGKRVEQYICDFNAPVEAAVGDLGMTEAPQQMEVEEVNMRYSDTVDWTCLMSLFKDIAAVLPMRCVQRALIDRALDLYEGTSRWARSLYARTASPTPVSEWTTSKASAWSAIARISNFYGREMSPYSFMLEKTLDRNLSLYIRRAQLLLDLASCQSSGQTAISEGYTHRAVLSTTSFHDIHLGVDPEFLIAEEREEGEPEEGHDEHTPHCLCRLPETEGESATLVQCENCDSWLHPQCINRRGLEGGAIRAKRAVFVCPLCLHVDNAVSSLADVVSQEWFDRHLFKKPKNAFSLFSNYNQLLPEGIEALCPYQFGTTSNDNRGIQNLFLDTLSDVFSVFTTGSKVTLTASLNDSASKCKVKVRANVTPKTADSRRSGPWSEVELAAFLKAAEMLPLKRCPSVPLLQLVSLYVSTWRSAVDTLITESEPMLLTMHASLKGLTVQGIPHRQVPLAMLEAEACCIARAQFLYCCVRLLGVAPVDELFRLRLFVWSLSAGCLLRRREKMKDVTQDKNSGHQYTSVNSDCMAAIIMRSQRANAEELIDLDALARAESNGRSLIQSTISEEAKSPRDWRRGGYGTLGSVAWETLSVLHALVVACYNALKAARGYNLTDGVDKLKAILQSLLDLSCTIAMTSSFGVVRLMNIEFRSAKKRLAMTQNGYASNDNKMTGMREDTQDVSKVQYCWCHGSEFGRMICCDDCEEWFHCSCMGLEKRVNLKNIIGFCCIACAEEKQVSYEFEWS